MAVLSALALSGCTMLASALDDDETGVFTLAVGDCLNDASESGEVSAVPVVDCAEPHDSEVFASISIDLAEYPGEAATIDAADSACRDAFTTFVGVASSDSIYSYATLYPTETSWSGGDREILCRIALIDENGEINKLTGTLADARE